MPNREVFFGHEGPNAVGINRMPAPHELLMWEGLNDSELTS